LGINSAGISVEIRGNGQGKQVYDPKKNGCWITFNSPTPCAGDQTLQGTFRDYDGEQKTNAGSNVDACFARARDYFLWCKFTTTTVTASYNPLGQQKLYDPATYGCWISIPIGVVCSQGSTWQGVFEDLWGESNRQTATDKQACFQRANEYSTWCTVPPGTQITATFRLTGEQFVYSTPFPPPPPPPPPPPAVGTAVGTGTIVSK